MTHVEVAIGLGGEACASDVAVESLVLSQKLRGVDHGGQLAGIQ